MKIGEARIHLARLVACSAHPPLPQLKPEDLTAIAVLLSAHFTAVESLNDLRDMKGTAA